MKNEYTNPELVDALKAVTGVTFTSSGVRAWRRRLGYVPNPRGGNHYGHGVDLTIKESGKQGLLETWAKDLELTNQALCDKINEELDMTWSRPAISRWRRRVTGRYQPQRPHGTKPKFTASTNSNYNIHGI